MTEPSSHPAAPGGTALLAGRPVARIGYGTAQLRGVDGDLGAATDLVRRALDLGVMHLDTAQFYGDGFANRAVRLATAGRDDVLVATKVGADPATGPVPLVPAQRPEQLRASVEDNLRSLGRDHLDLVNLRRLDTGPGLRASGDQAVDLDDQLAVMIELRDAGTIGAIGLSAVTADGLRQALPAGLACVQNAYSLLDRADEELLVTCAGLGLAWVPFFPLGGAFPGLPKVTEQPAVVEHAGRLRCTPAQLGLAWLLAHSPATLLIPGTSDVGHLAANLAVGDVELDDAAVAALDAVAVAGEPAPPWPPRG